MWSAFFHVTCNTMEEKSGFWDILFKKKKIFFFHPGRKKDLQPARFIMYRIHRTILDAGWWIESHVPYFTSGHSDFPTFYSLITVKNFSVITTTSYLFCILLFPFFPSASSNLVCCIISPPCSCFNANYVFFYLPRSEFQFGLLKQGPLINKTHGNTRVNKMPELAKKVIFHM